MMKTEKTIPNNLTFFNEHGLNYTAYGLIGFIGQILSGLSLLYAIYSLIIAKLNADIVASRYSYIIFFTAAIITLFVELANRKLARPAIKPWVLKDLFIDEPAARNRHIVLTRSYRIILCLVAVVSYLLSGIGSIEYAEDSAAQPELIPIDSVKQVFQHDRSLVKQAFKVDSSLLVPVFNERLKAMTTRFNSDSLALIKTRSKYINCANDGNEWCTIKLTNYLTDIDISRRLMSDSLAAINREKMVVLQDLLKKRDGQLDLLQKEKKTAIGTASIKNEQRIVDSQSEASLTGYIFMLLTIVGQTIFYLMIYLQLQIEAGSGIEQNVSLNEFWDKPSIMEELNTTLTWRIERGIRRLIASVFSEPDRTKITAIPYWKLVKQASEVNSLKEKAIQESDIPKNGSPEIPCSKSKRPSCSVKDTPLFNQDLADAKSKLSIYKKRVGKQKQKAIVQKRNEGKVTQRTQNAIINNEKWVKHWTAEVKRLSNKSPVLNGHKVQF